MSVGGVGLGGILYCGLVGVVVVGWVGVGVDGLMWWDGLVGRYLVVVSYCSLLGCSLVNCWLAWTVQFLFVRLGQGRLESVVVENLD
jgi:hypothetical protein